MDDFPDFPGVIKNGDQVVPMAAPGSGHQTGSAWFGLF
jgi:hypothetical protein